MCVSFPRAKNDVLQLKCQLTVQIWFFSSEVSHHSLQLAQLTMGRVNVCLAVGPTSTHKHKTTKKSMIVIFLFRAAITNTGGNNIKSLFC